MKQDPAAYTPPEGVYPGSGNLADASEHGRPPISSFNATTPGAFTMAIIKQVANEHGVTAQDILGTGRLRKFTVARHEAIRRVKAEKPNLSYPAMGLIFHRDHDTIMYALGKLTKRRR